jgi:hypothetical protein
MTSECDNLDAYLAEDLPPAARAQFALHLTECEPCRENIAQQRWIDNLLCSDERASLEPVPLFRRETFLAPTTPRRQSTRVVACGLAAVASVCIVAVGLALKQTGPVPQSRQPATSNVASRSTTNAATPRATFVSNGDTIAVPLESPDDNVTIVQLFPTTVTERQTRLELVLQLSDSQSDGG